MENSERVAKQAEGAAVEEAPRIDVKGLALRLLLSLLLPVTVALLLDLLLGTLPWMTLAMSLVCIPLATVIVGNATLRDFERVVALVAPYETAAQPEVQPEVQPETVEQPAVDLSDAESSVEQPPSS